MSEARAAMLQVEEARERILADVDALGAERVALPEALGRVLAEPVVAPSDIPPRDNTAMDGFAVRAEDVAKASAERPAELVVVETLPAGYVATQIVGPGQAIRIVGESDILQLMR